MVNWKDCIVPYGKRRPVPPPPLPLPKKRIPVKCSTCRNRTCRERFVVGKMIETCSMGCFGLSVAVRSGGKCRRRMAPGSLCMPDLLNGGTMVHWKPYFAHCPQMRIWKT